jgi:class 3 adenylate cyclase
MLKTFFLFFFKLVVVQIIDDDKGVHIVTAIGLYESALFPSVVGLSICKTLQNKEVGCAVGMAYGSSFCGVTGCATVACRWDITGPPAVRAARLMQFALLQGYEIVIDESVYDDPLAATQMKVLDSSISLKGSLTPLAVYTLADCAHNAAFGILETNFGKKYIV